METFSRMVKKALIDADHAANKDGETLRAVEVTVRQHLSMICTIDDDPGTYYPEVTIELRPQLTGRKVPEMQHNANGEPTGEKWVDEVTGDILVVGTIARDRVAPYLEEGWTPEQDAADNPLAVHSIEHEEATVEPVTVEIVQAEGETA